MMRKYFSHVYKPFMQIVLLMSGCIFVLGTATAQPQGELEQVKSEIEQLKSGQEALKREISEIKSLVKTSHTKQSNFEPSDLDIEGAAYQGKVDAPITLVEFSDYQCPYCRKHATNTLPELVKRYVETGKVRYVIRDLPVEHNHPQAFVAAEAARCSGKQGHYWEMHEVLFENQSRLKREDLTNHAEKLGLNMPEFSQCMNSSEEAKAIRKDLKAGMQAGVRGTPTFFLGLTQKEKAGVLHATRVIRGAKPFSEFQEVIDELLASVEKAP